MMRSHLRWGYLCLKIIRQMHHNRLHHAVGRIEDVDALYRTVASVYVIKLHFLNIRFDFAQQLVVRTGKVYHAAHNFTSHHDDERLVRGIAVEAYLLHEGTHLLGVVDCLDRKSLACSNLLLRIFHRCAAAALQYVIDHQSLVALVLHHELSSYRLAEHHLSAVHHLVLGCYLLCRCRQRQQR